MKATRILSLVLAFVMLCSCFLVGCSGDKGKDKVGGEVLQETEQVDESKIYDAEIKNLNGHEFHFKSIGSSHPQLTTHEIFAEELTGDKINDAVFTRNAQLAEKYNCTITEEQTATPSRAVREPLIAGEYVADFLFDVSRELRTLAAQNLLADFSMLDNIDLDKAWWDDEARVGLNLGGKTFFIAGDACTKDDRAAWLMWFNKDIIEEYDDTIDLYQEVRDGKWTLDRMYELMVATKKDLTGDGMYLPGEDRFGYIGERYNNFGHVCSCNMIIGKVDDAGNYDIPLTPKQELLDVWAALKPVLTSPYREVSYSGAHFRKGLGTFYACNTGAALQMGDTTYKMGALPMPKLNEEQEFYHNGVYFSQVACFAIPLTANNCEDWETNGFTSGVEQAAYFLEAFGYYSMNILTPAFYDQVLLKQSVRDTDSAEMIEIAMAHKVYDPIAGYNFGNINIYSEVGSAGQNDIPGTDVNYDNFVSTYESRANAARKALQNYINFISTDTGNMEA